MWLIPGKTKVSLEIFKGMGIVDIAICIFQIFLILMLVVSNFPLKVKLAIVVVIVVVTVLLVIRIDDEPNYQFLMHIIKHCFYPKHFIRAKSDLMLLADSLDESQIAAYQAQEKEIHIETKEEKKARLKKEKEEWAADNKKLADKNTTKEESDAIWLKRAKLSAERKQRKKEEKSANTKWSQMTDIIGFTGIKDGYIAYGGEYYGAVVEIPAVEFRFFSQYRRNNTIKNGLGKVLAMASPDYAVNIVKIERPVHYEHYVDNEHKKIEELKRSFENGMLSEEELKSRIAIILDRIDELENYINVQKIIVPFYYLVIFDEDKEQLENHMDSMIDNLVRGEMNPKRLDDKELAIFLKYTNELDFDETEIDKIKPEDYAAWAMPRQLDIRVREAEIDKILAYTMRVTSYPTMVDDAWMAYLMSIPGTKCVVKCKPMDRAKSVRRIDRSLSELRVQYMSTSLESKQIELQSHIDSLSELLVTLQSESETLMEVNFYITVYDIELTNMGLGDKGPLDSYRTPMSNMRKTIRRLFREENMKLASLYFEQLNCFIASQVSAYDPFAKYGRGIPSNSIAAGYPWVYANIADENGIKIGLSDGVPVFLDFFRRDSERVNSNMVIVGKSGSGKSYSTKSILTNLAADDTKIFILDPENEYTELAENLHGKFINVGNALQGRLNPFNIITALDDSEGGQDAEESTSASYATHLQFLEEFFKQILPDCDKDALEYLNIIVDRLYADRDINDTTDLSTLRPEDYPIFDDLYDAILQEFQKTDNEYVRTLLRTLMNYIAKFSTGGRNANIWNGPSTITTDENFTVFNFQSLLANRNGLIANAQMLLVLKYIDNEIIKNREYNSRYNMHRKIIVVIDEAHVFIDTKFPVALDFMFQLAKRIRKYNGMQIVITQNIKDFVGSEEIARKSTAIINACQYSFIFSLSPNDMDDLCKLYEKAGGINEVEQEQIITARRGHAFTVTGPTSRSSFGIEVPKDVVGLFSERNYEGPHFKGEEGEDVWERFISKSRAKHDESKFNSKAEEVEHVEEKIRKSFVSFEMLSEDEYENTREEEEKKKTAKKKKTISFEEIDEDDYIPDIPEDPEEFAKLLAKKKGEQAEESQTPAAVPVSVPAPAAAQSENSKTEEILTKLLEAFSHEAMMSEVRHIVESEMAKRVGNVTGMVSPAVEISPAVAIGPSLTVNTGGSVSKNVTNTSEVSEPVEEEKETDSETEDILGIISASDDYDDYEDDDEYDSDDYDDSGFDSDDSESESYDTGKYGESRYLGGDETDKYDSGLDDGEDDYDLLGVDDGSELSSSYDEDEESERTSGSEYSDESDDSDDSVSYGAGAIDIMSILTSEAQKLSSTSNIEQMELYDEDVIDITFEDLALYIKNSARYY